MSAKGFEMSVEVALGIALDVSLAVLETRESLNEVSLGSTIRGRCQKGKLKRTRAHSEG